MTKDRQKLGYIQAIIGSLLIVSGIILGNNIVSLAGILLLVFMPFGTGEEQN